DGARGRGGPGRPHPGHRRGAHRRAAPHGPAPVAGDAPPDLQREAAAHRGAPALEHGHAPPAGADDRGPTGGRDGPVGAGAGPSTTETAPGAGDVTAPPLDVAVVGGGPAGLAVAAMAARRGLSVILLERAPLPHDKACGEGVMRPGLAVLAALGVLDGLPASESGAIRGVRYVQEDGSALEGALPGSGGLGIRR